MSMDPPKVLLESSFLGAVADPLHPRHLECVAAYRILVDGYEREELLLTAVGDHLRAMDVGEPVPAPDRVAWFLHRRRVGMFAPVDPLYVGFQHRRAARAATVDDPDVALTLVMCDRYGIRRMATVRDDYAAYDLDLVPLPAVADTAQPPG